MSEKVDERTASGSDSDLWSEWLLFHRHGGNPLLDEKMRAEVLGYADRVLDACALKPGMKLVDVGAGDGLVAFRAIERVGTALTAVLVDISAPLLGHARQMASALQIDGQCTFIEASAEDLLEIRSSSVDAVTTRAALAYVSDKAAALREFHRILRGGGRVSIAEPLLQDDALETIALKTLAEQRGGMPGHELLPLLHRWKSAHFPDTPERLASSALANYSERDLLRLFKACGFQDIHLELHIDVRKSEGQSWETFLQAAPHPWSDSNGEILARRFSSLERFLLEEVLRPAVEQGGEPSTQRVVYVSATKPQGME